MPTRTVKGVVITGIDDYEPLKNIVRFEPIDDPRSAPRMDNGKLVVCGYVDTTDDTYDADTPSDACAMIEPGCLEAFLHAFVAVSETADLRRQIAQISVTK